MPPDLHGLTGYVTQTGRAVTGAAPTEGRRILLVEDDDGVAEPLIESLELGGIEIDMWSREVTLPAGVTIDPGAIGKGLAADIVATELVEGGAVGALVNLGGDLRALGTPATAGWTISVPDPAHHGRELIRIASPTARWPPPAGCVAAGPRRPARLIT